jgi:two-component system OmpR family sensor kinase
MKFRGLGGMMDIVADTASPVPDPRIWGIRFRILFWYVLILGLAVVAAVVVVQRVLVIQVEEHIDAELNQEAAELEVLSTGRDPETGEPFEGDVQAIFDVFLRRNIPGANEMYVTFLRDDLLPKDVDCATSICLYQRSFPQPPYRLDLDPELTERWAGVTEPERGEAQSPAGLVEYLAVPVQVEGQDQIRGVFVAAIFHDLEVAEVQPAVWGAAVVGIAALLIGSILAWRVAEGVLRPVRQLTMTARASTEGDLSRRIQVRGRDEISLLAATFNEMLDRLEEAFATQRQFVDDAGHELRTPITVIRGHLELLEEDPEEREQTIALVTDELDRMSRIVNDLLVLAKAQRPDFLNLEAVDVATLTEEVLAKARALGPRDWQLEGVARRRVIADRQRLTQALMQLAVNAAAHTADGDRIGLGSAISNGEARLWVKDSGPGVAFGERDLIFRRFSRGEGRRASDGAGLGLAIVRAIAEAHSGRVELESPPGKGAKFSVVIPTEQPEARDEVSP